MTKEKQINTMKQWTDTERLVIGDIISHLKLYGYNGWIPVMFDVCEAAGMKPLISWLKEEIASLEQLTGTHWTALDGTTITIDKGEI